MKKIISWIWDNILFLETLFLIAFIPLFPKIPILDIKNTWVYVRGEDFVVFFVLLSWIFLLLKQKITLKTPLTIPIITFWIIGAIATMHGVLLIFPTIANVFPNVAFLSLVRHIEYMSLFFIAYQGMKDKRFLPIIIAVLVFTLLSVIGYGFGQKYLGLPAYLTMNEEFAKGIPITLSSLSRVSSTFAGHYDLAAYLVLIIPIVVSLFFGFKNWIIKIFLLTTAFLGLILLNMTVSRVSFFVLFVSLLIVLFFQKKKLVFLTVPLLFVFALLVITFQPSLLDRFKSTISEVDVVIDAKTGDSVGHVRFVQKDYFKDKIVLQKRVKDKEELIGAISGNAETLKSSASALLPFEFIPQEVPLVLATNVSTGESLPQGTGYINLALSPVIRRLGNFYYELPPDIKATFSAQVLVLHGDFVVKRAAAYDLSFTTRFQGEWPRALTAFGRNILIGSGYGSVSLAVDNNYLRILGEIGLLGFIAFFSIFTSLAIYIKKGFADIESPLAKSFVLGFVGGAVGLFLNATLIDVFEASKIAFVLWMLVGVTLAILMLYQKTSVNLFAELKKVATSNIAIAVYLLLFAVLLFSPMLANFFVGDDYTWLRWAADCTNNCSPLDRIISFFTQSNGFFFRPGTKVYFYVMESVFWLNQAVYHAVSLFLHFGVSFLFYLLSKRVFKSKLLAVLSAFLFLILSGYTEAVFWISSVGHLFTAFFALLSLLLFIQWDEKKKVYLYILSVISLSLGLMFHEMGIVIPLLIIAYKAKEGILSFLREVVKRKDYLLLFVPVVIYLLLRFVSQSHWLSGDYSYDFVMLPFNFAGNLLGYVSLVLVGQSALPLYETLRAVLRANLAIPVVLGVVALAALVYGFKKKIKIFNSNDGKIVVFGGLFFVISLLPYLGLGNITSRYSYLASLGLILIFVFLLNKLYEFLLKEGRQVALLAVSVIIIVFSLFQIIQIQQSYFDWSGAGEKARKFFISIDALYTDYWSKGEVQFHFVDVPLRVGDAWVFPVGISDAVWFAFQNKDAKVYLHPNVDTALQSAGLSLTNRVFVFNEDGSLREIDRYPEKQPVVSPN
ncbi:MAG: O-antigen ligase family protein [Candidatus Levybacteria bacterium]|nr:O-antigen ligase family protein [Candidatus Levybacteria bacterium]